MNTNLGYSKKTLTNTDVLLSGGGHKQLSDFIGSLNWDSTNRKLQYKPIGATSWTNLVTFGSNAMNSTSYLPLSGGTMSLGEGLQFHSDNNYFGTDKDARIISLLDGNGTTCDGGLIIDERGTVDGATTVTELLRIRDNEFKWKGNIIYHAGNLPAYPTKASWNYDDKYITFVGVTNDTTNHANQLRYVLNGTSNYFTVPYATSAGNADTVDNKHYSDIILSNGKNLIRNYDTETSSSSYQVWRVHTLTETVNSGDDITITIEYSLASGATKTWLLVYTGGGYTSIARFTATAGLSHHTESVTTTMNYTNDHNDNGVCIYYGPNGNTGTATIHRVKVERGDHFTGWSPAPEDIITSNIIGSQSVNYATSAGKWTEARTLTLTGSITGSASIDGSGDVSLTTTTNHNHDGRYIKDYGGNINVALYDIPTKHIFSGNNVTDGPTTGWISGLVLGSNWNNNHYLHYLVESGSRWYATRSYADNKMKDWNTFAYLTDINWGLLADKPTNFVYTNVDQEIASVKTIKNTVGIRFSGRSVNGTRASFYDYENWIHGGEDNASYLGCNVEIGTWYGFGIYPTISGSTRTLGLNSFWHNARTGNTYTWGDFYKFDGTNNIQACYVGTDQTISGTKSFDEGKWKLTGNDSNNITNEYFVNGKLYNNKNTNVVGTNYSIKNALKFTYNSTHWLIGNIRGSSTDTAGFGIALRDNTANNIHLIDCLRIEQSLTTVSGSIEIGNNGSNFSYIRMGYPGSGTYDALRYGGQDLNSADLILGSYERDTVIHGRDVHFFTNEQRTLTIKHLGTGSGRVGIGTVSPSYDLHVIGDIYASGSVSWASDIRLKLVENLWNTKLENIANAPVFLFKWKLGKDKKLHIGTSAQYWKDKIPELVMSDNEGYLSLQYGTLGAINSIVIARELLQLKEEFENLLNSYNFEVKNLQGQINILQLLINLLRN